MRGRLLPMLLAWALAAAVHAQTAAAEPETPRTAELDGARLGMLRSELQAALVSRGFLEHRERRREFREEAGDVRKRVRYRAIPGERGPTVHEIDHSIWYPPEGFDPERVRREIVQRFGDPVELRREASRVELLYLEDPEAPTYNEVAQACQEEIQRRRPELPAPQAEARAAAASLLSPSSQRIEEACPEVLERYRRFAANVAGPRMTVVIWTKMGRVDTRLSWQRLAADATEQAGN